jgi:hypothetical protein
MKAVVAVIMLRRSSKACAMLGGVSIGAMLWHGSTACAVPGFMPQLHTALAGAGILCTANRRNLQTSSLSTVCATPPCGTAGASLLQAHLLMLLLSLP